MQRVHGSPHNKVGLARTSLEDQTAPADLPDGDASSAGLHRLVEQGVSNELGALARIDARSPSRAREVEVEGFRRRGAADEDAFAGELGGNVERREAFLEEREAEVADEERWLEGGQDGWVCWLFGRRLFRARLLRRYRRRRFAAVCDGSVGPFGRGQRSGC